MTDNNKTNKVIKISNSSITKNTLKFLSWNIQAPSSTGEGNKFKIKEFNNVLLGNDFICLQEIRTDVYLTGYRSQCLTRKDNKSGGVGVLIKNELLEGVELIQKESCSDYIICKLNKDFFKQEHDTYLVNAYVVPYDSSKAVDENKGKDILNQVEDVVNNLKEKGEVILCGDFNSRIGQQPGMLKNDTIKFLPLPEDYESDEFKPRNSQDIKTNSHGTQFLRLITHNQLTLLNGRTLGDSAGKFTSIQRNGCSVIDYFAVTRKINQNVNYFKVLDFTPYSDHKPLSMELNCRNFNVTPHKPLHVAYQQAPTKFIFNDENKSKFIESLSSQNSKNTIQSLRDEITEIQNGQTEQTEQDSRHISKSINDINNKFTEHIRENALDSFEQTKPKPQNKHHNNNPWFNWQTRLAKRLLNSATRSTSTFPTSEFIRDNFYKVKGSYRRLLSKCETKYFENVNKDIENGKVLNWQSFKKLKNQKSSTKEKFDSLDMHNFESFFRDLYTDKHKTLRPEDKDYYIETADIINKTSVPNVNDNLNIPFTAAEVKSAIKASKSGKASAADMMSNEILKALDSNHIEFLTDLFNMCFDNSVYPWNESIITPLHKKGDKSNPDNYRAIAVSSVIGKIFSTLLLERLHTLRKNKCPDPPNQLGFTKGAQTYDHILTMQTIAAKYKKLKKPIYAIFVDFKKAFDSVCRQALFYKMAKLGITGKFYSVLRDMYSNSYAYIKLAGHLSKKFRIAKGTEQGHPLSPDLFKIFLHDLSDLLDDSDCPQLCHKLISHLLWADDLIMLSFSPETSQKQLDILNKYCIDWGIEVNEIKTQVVIFGSNSNINKGDSKKLSFKLGDKLLEIVDTYCYLGVVLHSSGELRTAQQTLKTKAMRAFFGLKRTVIRSKLSFKSLSTLFDSLIKPIALYGAPVWTPTSATIKSVIKHITSNPPNTQNFISKINRSTSEKVHLSFLKWALGVHKKASNVGVWGETGRYPLIYQSIRLTLNYYKRLLNVPHDTFIHAALKEQQSMNLPWYRNIEPFLKLDEVYHLDHVTAYNKINGKTKKCERVQHPYSLQNADNRDLIKSKPMPSKKFRVQTILDQVKKHFVECWEYEKSNSSKLSFYNAAKNKFAREAYLDVIKGFSRRYSTTKMRISSHDLEIERGRYSKTPRENRTCHWCKVSMGSETIEDEYHVLYGCDLYADLRAKLITNLNKSPQIQTKYTDSTQLQLNVNNQTLKSNMMKMLSPYHDPNLDTTSTNMFNYHHKALTKSITTTTEAEKESSLHRRSYIINCVGTFIYRALEKRKIYIRDVEDRKVHLNTITINFVNN